MNHADAERLMAYHHWANDCLLDVVAALPAEALERPLGGSFGSLRGLLKHMIGAELLWLERWRGRSPTAWPEVAGADGDGFRQEWKVVKAGEREMLAATPPDALAAARVSYVNLQGQPFTYPLRDVLRHLANHGTYHRGQLAHMLRELGSRAPMTDYLFYLDELASAS